MAKIKFGFYPLNTNKYDPTLPDLQIVEWYKKVGDKVELYEPILSFDSSKISGDMESPASGIIIEIYPEFIEESYGENGWLWESGNAEKLDDVPGGRVLYRPALGVIETDPNYNEEQESLSEPASFDGQKARDKRVVITMAARILARENNISDGEVLTAFSSESRIGPDKVSKLVELKNRLKSSSHPNKVSQNEAADFRGSEEGDRVGLRAVPMARHLLWEAGIGLREVQARGPDSLIVVKDAEREIEARKQRQIKVSDKVVLLRPSREWLMVRDNLEQDSAGNYVRDTIAGGEPLNKIGDKDFEEYDLSPLQRFEEDMGYLFTQAFKVRFRVWAPVAFAVCRTLEKRDFWTFNGYWHIEDKKDRTKDMVALYKTIDLGISYDRGKPPIIDLEKGTIRGQKLRIPTLHDAKKLDTVPFFIGLDTLMNNVDYDSAQDDGKIHKTTFSDWTGWTFIFNNVGAARHSRGKSILTSKISAMLNMGVIRKDGRCVFQIFFDHRMIDGVPAANFMDAVYEELVSKVLPELRRICYKS